MVELEPAVRELVATNPHRPAWRAALATLLCETDRLEEAAAELDVVAAGRLHRHPARRRLDDRDDAAGRCRHRAARLRARRADLRAAAAVRARQRGHWPGGRVPGGDRRATWGGWPRRWTSRPRRSSCSSTRSSATPRSGRRSSSPTRSSTTPGSWVPGRRPETLIARSARTAQELELPARRRRAGGADQRRTGHADRSACRGRYPRQPHVQDTRHRREAIGRARPRPGAAGRLHQGRGVPRGPRARGHLGRRPPRAARRSRRVRRAVQEVADGRSADRPRRSSSWSSATSAPRSR